MSPNILLSHSKSLNPLVFRVQRQLYCHIKQYEVGTLAVDGWAVTFGTARRGLGFPKPGSFCNTGFSVLGKAKTGFRLRFRFWKSHNCVHCESAGEGRSKRRRRPQCAQLIMYRWRLTTMACAYIFLNHQHINIFQSWGLQQHRALVGHLCILRITIQCDVTGAGSPLCPHLK